MTLRLSPTRLNTLISSRQVDGLKSSEAPPVRSHFDVEHVAEMARRSASLVTEQRDG